MTSSPFERSVTSFAISIKATAEDSGGGVTCAKTSFFGVAWAKAGALASATTPAAPATCRIRRRLAAFRELNLVTGILPDLSPEGDYSSRPVGSNRSQGVQRDDRPGEEAVAALHPAPQFQRHTLNSG